MPWDPRQSQFSDSSIDFERAKSICGPALAVAFVKANGGRAPSLSEATELAAAGNLWKQGTGMFGPEAEVKLMQKMGVNASYSSGVDWRSVAQRAQSGELIGLSTPNHYWQISGYDPETSRYYVGTSGTDMKRGSAWMTADQIADVGGGLHGLITTGETPRGRQSFMEANTDMPGSPTPATAAPLGTGGLERPPASLPEVPESATTQPGYTPEMPPALTNPYVMPGAADDPIAAVARYQQDADLEQKRRERAGLTRSLISGFEQQPEETFALPDAGLQMPTLKMPGGFKLPSLGFGA